MGDLTYLFLQTYTLKNTTLPGSKSSLGVSNGNEVLLFTLKRSLNEGSKFKKSPLSLWLDPSRQTRITYYRINLWDFDNQTRVLRKCNLIHKYVLPIWSNTFGFTRDTHTVRFKSLKRLLRFFNSGPLWVELQIPREGGSSTLKYVLPLLANTRTRIRFTDFFRSITHQYKSYPWSSCFEGKFFVGAPWKELYFQYHPSLWSYGNQT